MPSGALGSDASRLHSGMHPSSNGLMNLSQNATIDLSPGQSHKRDVRAMEELLKPSIVVKPYPTNLSLKPRSLQPLMLLPREHFQLSFLDLSSPYGSFESSRCFESSIKILDLEGRMGSRPVLLIARLESDRTVYALERQANGRYTLCHFGSWVNLQELQELAVVSLARLIEKRPKSAAESQSPIPLTTPQLYHDNKKKKLAIEAIQSLVKKPVRARSVSTPSQLNLSTPGLDNTDSQPDTIDVSRSIVGSETHESQPTNQLVQASGIDDLPDAPTAEAIFDIIRSQYLESLYHSMGSLAYFAKGPLSRARGAFHLDIDSNLEMGDLVEFLKSLVLTTAQIDRKYRETIPDIISKMKSIFQDSDAEQEAKAKKRKSKKMKLGRDSLYPMEDERVRKWWNARKPEFKEDEGMTTVEPQETKLHVAWLRSRETQLQMIIILEILALEPLLVPKDDKDSQLPGLSGEEETSEKPKVVMPKKRNKHNLPSLVDIHADRLCIWQSTALDEVKLPESQTGQGPETQKSGATSDPLKDFCVDIIVPFFSARLSEKCDSINRKLGGPVMMPPPRPRQKKPEKPEPTPKSKSKSSSSTKRTSSSKPATLEKVLSKETEKHRRSISRGPSGAIALMRSASTPMLKRETSEPLSLSNIPKADSVTSQKAMRPPVLGAIKRRPEDKVQKEALAQAELRDAITAIRRPNRDVVGKAMAESAERRAITSLSQLKKSRKPTQHPRPSDVVKATPIGNRFRDVFGSNAHSQPMRSLSFSGTRTNGTPSSSLIPSSAPRKRSHETAFTLDKSPSITQSATSRSIEATPSRPSSLKHSFLSAPNMNDDEDVLASSPIMSRKSSSMSFHDSGIGMPQSPEDELTETPVKPRAVPLPLEDVVAVTPSKRRLLEKDMSAMNSLKRPTSKDGEEPKKQSSIYERLGWDDDFDELA
ncbi:hypothetical protein M426DRAFT_319793 [Hypoxylon sp. CI-4A]|nr:hypothetical protein M426DRAFT_319793 [Hypoxylon sp. CI-4A]